MPSAKKTLGLLPVRGGSQGLPGKNSRLLAGKPLLGWAAESLANAPGIDYAFCSTDSPELAAMARTFGLESDPLRPAELATSDSLVIETVRHVISEQAALGREFDRLALVQATSPFVTPLDIQKALDELNNADVDSVVSVARVPDDYHPSLMYRLEKGVLIHAGDSHDTFRRRQDRSAWFRRVGLILSTRVSTIQRFNALVAGKVRFVEIEPSRAINIDYESDFQLAEKVARNDKL